MGWWTTGLFDLDEGFYGAITAEMNRRGEWITPYYAGNPWFEKPILLYWVSKPFLNWFGPDIGPRMGAVLASILTLLWVFRFSRKHFGDATAGLATLILGGSLLFIAPGRMMLTDPLLVLCICVAFGAFWDSLEGDRVRNRAIFGFALGVSVLAKGPVAVLLFVPLLAWTAFRQPTVRPLVGGGLIRGGWLWAGVLFTVAVASWYLPAYLINRDVFVQKFLIEQNLQRFTGGDEAHTLNGLASFVFFLPVLILGMLPWSLWLIPSWFRRPHTVASPDLRSYLAAWAGITFLFFTFSGAKLVHYIMPCLPPLAILVGDYLQHRKWARPVAIAWVGMMAVVVNGLFVWYYRESGQAEAHRKIRSIPVSSNPVLLYQISRREADRGTGTLRLRETSLPSLYLYGKSPMRAVETLDEIAGEPPPFTIFTRRNRLSDADLDVLRETGWTVNRPILKPGEDYELITVR